MNTQKTFVDLGKMRGHIGDVLKLRRLAWEICQTLDQSTADEKMPLVQRLPRVCVLASSSRGGTSVTAELLQWQGANCVDPRRRFLTLPGEEKPHLILAGLAFPSRDERFDDLNEADARSSLVSGLLQEMGSEIGYPLAQCDNLELYATQLYRRLLLQWPTDLAKLKMDDAIARLTKALEVNFPRGYCDSVDNRRQVLGACVRCFPFIRPSFYDCWPHRSGKDVLDFAGQFWSIEETPFVLPPPWRNATQVDLESGCLLLRDPSNAWRLPFWRAVFPGQALQVLHLVRDPREAVQGLCDGWNYPYGFQTIPSEEVLAISGYTDSPNRGESEWKQHCLKFSINRTLSRKLLNEHQRASLVEVCAFQWLEAHRNEMLVTAEARKQNMPNYTLYLAELARRAGGQLYFLREIGNLSEIYRRIALAIGAQYALGFYPSAGTARPGWRSLRVELAAGANVPPGSKLTYRGSYYVFAFQ